MSTVETAEVLVTVKAYPQLSNKHGEVVCVAGVRLDQGQPEWIRLFPVPFRDLPEALKFRKYQVIRTQVRRGSDKRPESYRLDLDNLEVVRDVDTGKDQLWGERRHLMGDLVGQTTMCRLYRENESGGPAPSLGLVRPAEVMNVIVESNTGFDTHRKHLAELAAEETLLAPAKAELEPSPYIVKYHYRCLEPGCRTHTQTLIDWEVAEAGRKWSRQYPPQEIPDRIRAKFLEQLCGDDREPYFFVGNQKLHLQSFLVLGVFWPRVVPPQEAGLF